MYLTEDVKKNNGLGVGAETLKTKGIQQAAVIGAGVMGGGIAQLFGDRGVSTRMKDINTNALALGMKSAGSILKRKLKRRRISKREYWSASKE